MRDVCSNCLDLEDKLWSAESERDDFESETFDLREEMGVLQYNNEELRREVKMCHDDIKYLQDQINDLMNQKERYLEVLARK